MDQYHQYSWHGLLSMQGGGDPFRGGVRAMDDRIGPFLTVATKVMDAM